MCLAESEQKDDHSLVWYLKEFTTTKSLNTQKHRLYHVFQILVEAERSWTKLLEIACRKQRPENRFWGRTFCWSLKHSFISIRLLCMSLFPCSLLRIIKHLHTKNKEIEQQNEQEWTRMNKRRSHVNPNRHWNHVVNWNSKHFIRLLATHYQ